MRDTEDVKQSSRDEPSSGASHNREGSNQPVRKSKSAWRIIRNRLIAGLFVALPILITFVVIHYIANLLVRYVIGPVAYLILMIWEDQANGELPWAIEYVAAPALAVLLVLCLLFLSGMFFQSRIHRLVDWFLRTVPGVSTVYSAVSNVFQSIQRTATQEIKFQRVVLIDFPHPGSKVPAFVTNECTDRITKKRILCIYVPTTPIPTSGYMLMIPEEDVVPLDWDIQITLQAIVSGGISVPNTVNYYRSEDAALLETGAADQEFEQ